SHAHSQWSPDGIIYDLLCDLPDRRGVFSRTGCTDDWHLYPRSVLLIFCRRPGVWIHGGRKTTPNLSAEARQVGTVLRTVRLIFRRPGSKEAGTGKRWDASE